MPHTNRKKKTSSSSTSKSKPTIVHTKRQEILDEEGWTHVVDTPRKRSATLTKAANGGILQAGDFEIGGVAYVVRSAEEMAKEVEFWGKVWREITPSRALVDSLNGQVGGEEEIEEEVEEEVVGEAGLQGQETQSAKKEEEIVVESTEETKFVGTTEEIKPSEPIPTSEEDTKPAESNPETKTASNPSPEEALPQEQPTPTIPQPPTQRRKVDNIIVLGLGSLQSARREGRRATLTQLAALQTIVSHFESLPENTVPLKITLQEPLFTPTDKTYLLSLPNYEIVEDPEAFTKITEGSLVYGIHCYAAVYKAVAECGVRPAVLIGTDVGNFGRFNLSESADKIQAQLEDMVSGCEVLDFPQVRHDFSDTKIYWRRDVIEEGVADEKALVDMVDELSIKP